MHCRTKLLEKNIQENLSELGLVKDFLSGTKGPSQSSGERKVFLINDAETAGYLYGKI